MEFEVNKLMYHNANDKKTLERAPIKQFIRKENTEQIDEAIIKREKMVIYILVNYPKESYDAIKNIIMVDDIKSERNQKIVAKIYEQYAKNNFNDVLNLFEEEDIINYLSGIMADDLGIADLNKCIEDLINIYNKEKLINRRNSILKQLENTNGMENDEIRKLEKELNDVIISLAKSK